MDDPSILYPVLTLIGWTFAMWFWMYATRIPAMQKLDVRVPVVVRLSGTNVEQGRALLKESGFDIITANDLADAAKKAVAAAG